MLKGILHGKVDEAKETVNPEVINRLYPYHNKTSPQFNHIYNLCSYSKYIPFL